MRGTYRVTLPFLSKKQIKRRPRRRTRKTPIVEKLLELLNQQQQPQSRGYDELPKRETVIETQERPQERPQLKLYPRETPPQVPYDAYKQLQQQEAQLKEQSQVLPLVRRMGILEGESEIHRQEREQLKEDSE